MFQLKNVIVKRQHREGFDLTDKIKTVSAKEFTNKY